MSGKRAKHLRRVSGAGGKGQGAMKLKVNFDDLPDVVCEKCGGTVFAEGRRYKKLSKFQSPDGQARYPYKPAGYCVACSEPLPLKP